MATYGMFSFADGVILSLRFTDNMVLMDCLGLLTLRVWSISGRKTHVLRICVALVVASVVLLLLVSGIWRVLDKRWTH